STLMLSDGQRLYLRWSVPLASDDAAPSLELNTPARDGGMLGITVDQEGAAAASITNEDARVALTI
ncbi:MAG TPA: hypothetical protein VM283_02780, partial [Armatimonadota bacterium]|nr:hypothetical protein [Armatimonadota bacterium]